MIASPKEIHDGLIMARFNCHWNESLEHFKENNIVGLFLQGSQNYQLDNENSDIDTKLIITPSFKQLAMNTQPVSTTHIRDNNEHIDFKDIRLYMQTFRKQNLNFLEILFTPYKIINPLYATEWNRLIANREEIAHMNPWRAVKSMKGVAENKYKHMKHPFPSKIDTLEKYGYDPKELHHLARVYDYMQRYANGESYESCLVPKEETRDFLLTIKQGVYSLPMAEAMADFFLREIEGIEHKFCSNREDEEDKEMRDLLNNVCYNIMKISVENELKEA